MMKKSFKFLLSFVFILILMQVTTVYAAGTVGDGTPASCNEAALNTALAGGGLVEFNCGGAVTITLTSQKTISANTTINGGGLITLSGGGVTRLFEVSTGVTLNLQSLTLDSGQITIDDGHGGAVKVDAGGTLTTSGVTFTNHFAANNGGAIYSDGTINIATSSFTDHQGDNGGAIYMNAGTATVSGSTFTTNEAFVYGGAIYVNAGNLTISDSTFTGNTAGDFADLFNRDGGAIFLSGGGTHSITDSTFDGNASEDNGGGIFVLNGSVTITDTLFQNHNNPFIQDGAGLYVSSGTTTINGGSFINNQASINGGAIRVVDTGILNVNGTTFTSNSAENDGGAIANSNSSVVTVINATFTSNSADDGGAIYHDATTLMTVTDATFTGNQANGEADGDGGAMFIVVAGSGATITGSSFINNSARDDAGAIYSNAQPFTISDTTFSGNSANGESAEAFGGALYLSESVDDATITLSSFLNNSVNVASDNISSGGAIANTGDGLVLANVTFSGNSANKTLAGTADPQGGGLYTSGGDATTVYNSTFSGNSVFETGGTPLAGGNIYNAGLTTLANTIVANGDADGASNNCAGTITNGGFNIEYPEPEPATPTCGTVISYESPQLGALTGSPAYFPIASSLTNPALDAGDNTVCANSFVNNESQNGLTRPIDGDQDSTAVCDIGSYESPADVTDPTVTINQAVGQADPTNISLINFTVVFSETVTGFTTGDVTLSGLPGTLLGTVTEVAPNDGTTYNVAVSGMTGDGTLTATIASAVAEDTGGNPNSTSSSTDNAVTYDITSPTPVITGPASPTTRNSFTITIDFGEPVVGFEASDIVVGNGNLELPLVDEGNGVFSVTVSVASNGVVTINVPAGAAQDLAGNNNLAAQQFSVRVQTAGSGTAGTSALPATGFPQGVVTTRAAQPESAAYDSTEIVLKIPALGLSIPIVGVPLSENGWDVTWLDNAVGYLEGSAFPTWAGNTVITGHVWDANNQPGAFINIKELKYGDRIEIEAWGQTYVYEVRESLLVTPSNVGSVFQHEEYDWVTLVTCEDYQILSGDYSFRRIVRAVLVSVN